MGPPAMAAATAAAPAPPIEVVSFGSKLIVCTAEHRPAVLDIVLVVQLAVLWLSPLGTDVARG